MAQMLNYAADDHTEDDEGTFAAGEVKVTTSVMSSLCFMATAIPPITDPVPPKVFDFTEIGTSVKVLDFTEIEKAFGIEGLAADNEAKKGDDTAEEQHGDNEQEPPPPGCAEGGSCTCCNHGEAGAAEASPAQAVITPTSTILGSLIMLIYALSVAVGAGAWALSSAFKTLNNPRKIMYEAEGLGQAAWRAFVIASLWGVVHLLTAALARLAVFMAGGDLGDPGETPEHGATRPWNKRGPCRSALAGAGLKQQKFCLLPLPPAASAWTDGRGGRALAGLEQGGFFSEEPARTTTAQWFGFRSHCLRDVAPAQGWSPRRCPSVGRGGSEALG